MLFSFSSKTNRTSINLCSNSHLPNKKRKDHPKEKKKNTTSTFIDFDHLKFIIQIIFFMRSWGYNDEPWMSGINQTSFSYQLDIFQLGTN